MYIKVKENIVSLHVLLLTICIITVTSRCILPVKVLPDFIQTLALGFREEEYEDDDRQHGERGVYPEDSVYVHTQLEKWK